MSFRGFSEEDIRKIGKPQDVNKSQKGSYKTSLKKVTFKPNHTVNHSSKPRILQSNNVNNVPTQDVPDDAKLNILNKANNPIKPPDVQSSEPKLDKPEDKKFKDLEEFETRQKLIEEQNRKRKELLAKALADRTKRTQEEAQKLNEIQEEFRKLDAILSSDVKILRKQIELASIDYMESQKRYLKIEKEFLDAKLLMQQRQEKKEMLTEHLCTIIEKNEERKADKLNDLLERLQLTPPEINLKEVESKSEENG